MTQACVELLFLEGICRYFPQNQLLPTMLFLTNLVNETPIETSSDLQTVETAIRVLTEIIPIYGDAIGTEWREFASHFFPFLSSGFHSLQGLVQRFFLVIATVDETVVPNMLFLLSSQLVNSSDSNLNRNMVGDLVFLNQD